MSPSAPRGVHESPPPRQGGGLTPSRLGIVLGAGALLAAGVVAAVLFWRPAPTPQAALDDKSAKQTPPAATSRVRSLDELPPFKHHVLLDRMPFPVGSDFEDIARWRWDKDQETLDARGHDFVYFPLGTTRRSHYAFQAGITQNPPSGNVGVFWGYHEDEDRKKEKTPGVEFAWFQTLCLERSTDKGGGYRDQIGRGRGSLKYNKNLDVVPFRETFVSQSVQLRPGESILRVEILGNRLEKAELGALPLTQLYDAEANKLFQFHADHYKGAVGVFSLRGHAATFSNVRFFAFSSN